MDGHPEGDEIVFSVRKLWAGRTGGISGMKAEKLKTWIREATSEKEPDIEKWDKLVSIMQVVFQDGHIPEALEWATMVLIPNSGGGYIGIVLVKVIWKVCASILNIRLQSTTILRDALHGFRQGRGTRAAIMEAKLEHQLEGIVHKPLLQVFINVLKAYVSLDRGI